VNSERLWRYKNEPQKKREGGAAGFQPAFSFPKFHKDKKSWPLVFRLGYQSVVKNPTERPAYPAAPAAVAFRAVVGHYCVFPLRSPAGQLSRSRRGGRAHSLERRQASVLHGNDGFPGAMGAALVLARDFPGVPHQLGSGVSVGPMVCGVGAGQPQA
jgi:hypothetical protein